MRKSKYSVGFFGVNTIILLYCICIIRMIVPIEIFQFQTVINDYVVYPKIVDILSFEFIKYSSLSILSLLFSVWAVVSIALIISLFVRYRRAAEFYSKISIDNQVLKDRIERLNYLTENNKRSIAVKISTSVDSPMTYGFFKKSILLPDCDYTDTELRYILRHECCHIRNHDIWIKLLIEIYCRIFWWNPLSYLLKKDLDFCLEMKCDYRVTKELTAEQHIEYFEVLLSFLKKNSKSCNNSNRLMSSSFSKINGKERVLHRFSAIAEDTAFNKKNIFVNILSCLAVFVVVCTSYAIIIQPAGNPTAEDYTYDVINGEDIIIADDTNSYILVTSDGSYYFCFDDIREEINIEDYDNGMYEDYPTIYEE